MDDLAELVVVIILLVASGLGGVIGKARERGRGPSRSGPAGADETGPPPERGRRPPSVPTRPQGRPPQRRLPPPPPQRRSEPLRPVRRSPTPPAAEARPAQRRVAPAEPPVPRAEPARPAPSEVPASARRPARIVLSRDRLREAIILNEVLGPPLALREDDRLP